MIIELVVSKDKYQETKILYKENNLTTKTLLICPNECPTELLAIEYHLDETGDIGAAEEEGYLEVVCSGCGWDAIASPSGETDSGFSIEELFDPITLLPSSDSAVLGMAWEDYLIRERLEYAPFDYLD